MTDELNEMVQYVVNYDYVPTDSRLRYVDVPSGYFSRVSCYDPFPSKPATLSPGHNIYDLTFKFSHTTPITRTILIAFFEEGVCVFASLG